MFSATRWGYILPLGSLELATGSFGVPDSSLKQASWSF